MNYDGPAAVVFSTLHKDDDGEIRAGGTLTGETTTQFSFVSDPSAETAIQKIPLGLVGRAVGYERKVNVEVIAEGTTATPDQYNLLGGVIPAGYFTGYYMVEMKNLPSIQDAVVQVMLRITDSEDLIAGAKERLLHRHSWSARLLQPQSWSMMRIYTTSVYSSSAYRAIIEATGLTEFIFYDSDGNQIYDNAINDSYGRVYGRQFSKWIADWNAAHYPEVYRHDDGENAGEPVVPVY